MSYRSHTPARTHCTRSTPVDRPFVPYTRTLPPSAAPPPLAFAVAAPHRARPPRNSSVRWPGGGLADLARAVPAGRALAAERRWTASGGVWRSGALVDGGYLYARLVGWIEEDTLASQPAPLLHEKFGGRPVAARCTRRRVQRTLKDDVQRGRWRLHPDTIAAAAPRIMSARAISSRALRQRW